jgi:hypothetical protein
MRVHCWVWPAPGCVLSSGAATDETRPIVCGFRMWMPPVYVEPEMEE